MSIKPINIEEFSDKAKNVHEAIVASSRRARQINDEVKIEFNQRIEMFAPKIETDSEESDINPDQIKVSMEFEKRPKPTDLAIEELMQGKLHWRYKEIEEVPKVEDEPEAEETEED